MTATSYTTTLTTLFLDPTFYFNLSCIVLTFLTNLHRPDYVQSNLMNPFFLFVVSFYTICELFPSVLYPLYYLCLGSNKESRVDTRSTGGNNNIQLSYTQSMTARWYLQNACITHLLMDGVSGIFNVFPIMHDVYLKLDGRFHEPLSVKGMIATMTVELELFVMLPCTLAVWYGYRCCATGTYINNNNNTLYAKYPAWVYIMEGVVGAFHLSGTYFYDGAEWVHILFNTGLEEVPVDWKLELSKDHILYFWFGFVVAPIIWVIVPIWMIKRSISELNGLMGGPGGKGDINNGNNGNNGNTKKRR